MKKVTMLLTVCALLAAATAVSAADEITVTVDNKQVSFPDAKPFIEDEQTLVPMRAVFEALGADVEWDNDEKTVTSTDKTGNTVVKLRIGDDKMYVNGVETELDVPAKIVDDSTVIPVRAVAEGMNCDVDWDKDSSTVAITAKKNVSVSNPWSEYANAEELNHAIEVDGGGYSVKDITIYTDRLTSRAYRYLPDENLSEIQYSYRDETADVEAGITVRKCPGKKDISGVFGGTKTDSFTYNHGFAQIYRFENGYYATWWDSDGLYSENVTMTTESEDYDYILTVLTDILNNL